MTTGAIIRGIMFNCFKADGKNVRTYLQLNEHSETRPKHIEKRMY